MLRVEPIRLFLILFINHGHQVNYLISGRIWKEPRPPLHKAMVDGAGYPLLLELVLIDGPILD